MSSQPAAIEMMVVLVTGTLMLLSGLGKHRLEWRPKLRGQRRPLLRHTKPESRKRDRA